jgi:hypothetical protein
MEPREFKQTNDYFIKALRKDYTSLDMSSIIKLLVFMMTFYLEGSRLEISNNNWDNRIKIFTQDLKTMGWSSRRINYITTMAIKKIPLYDAEGNKIPYNIYR